MDNDATDRTMEPGAVRSEYTVAVADIMRVGHLAADQIDDAPVGEPAGVTLCEVLEKPPSDLQQSIWEALKGHCLTVAALVAEVAGGHHTRLYKPDGIKEMKEAGAVMNIRGRGYWRPDGPPTN